MKKQIIFWIFIMYSLFLFSVYASINFNACFHCSIFMIGVEKGMTHSLKVFCLSSPIKSKLNEGGRVFEISLFNTIL